MQPLAPDQCLASFPGDERVAGGGSNRWQSEPVGDFAFEQEPVGSMIGAGYRRPTRLGEDRCESEDGQAYVDSLAAASWLSAPIAKPQVGPDSQGVEVDRPRQPLQPDIGSGFTDVLRGEFFLMNKDFALGRTSVDKPKWSSNP